ncbi:MAG: lipoprotein [Candidatus Berkiella sp.]
MINKNLLTRIGFIFGLFICLQTLSGCGQTGPLYLPTDSHDSNE